MLSRFCTRDERLYRRRNAPQLSAVPILPWYTKKASVPYPRLDSLLLRPLSVKPPLPRGHSLPLDVFLHVCCSRSLVDPGRGRRRGHHPTPKTLQALQPRQQLTACCNKFCNGQQSARHVMLRCFLLTHTRNMVTIGSTVDCREAAAPTQGAKTRPRSELLPLSCARDDVSPRQETGGPSVYLMSIPALL